MLAVRRASVVLSVPKDLRRAKIEKEPELSEARYSRLEIDYTLAAFNAPQTR